MTYARESLTDRWARLTPQQRAMVVADLERYERPAPRRRRARMATAGPPPAPTTRTSPAPVRGERGSPTP